MNLSDFVLNFLEKKKIKNVFLITGGAISFMVDAFSRNKKIKYTCVAHEQAAAMMADSYSRLGPNLSCTMVTSGPGATNLITGIACSWFDSIPSIHITGQVNSYEKQGAQPGTKNTRQVGFQETDIVSITKPITKFSYQLKNPDEIKYILEKACYLATSGRPGPVVIDIPMDFQKAEVNPNKLKSFKLIKKKKKLALKSNVKSIFKLLQKSSRPVLLLGGGIKISKSEKILDNVLNKLSIPIVTTWSGVDLVDHNNQNYIGNVGVYGSRAANFAVQNSDFLLCLGSRLDTRITGGVPSTFARKSKIVVVDIDKNELSKKRGLKIYLKIKEDLAVFLKNFSMSIKIYNIETQQKWINICRQWKNKYPIIQKEYYKEKRFVNPYVFFGALSHLLTAKSVIIADDGGHLTWAVQAFKVKKGQKLFSAFGNSPMGYAFPASIGASILKNKSKVICIDGDGSIQMNIQELQTVKANNLPIKIFVLNNNGYGIIKQFQELYLNKRYEATTPEAGVTNPNFKKISKAYGINYSLIKNNTMINSTLKKVLRSNKPEFIEIFLKPDQKIIPKLQFGNPIEDLSPLLPRDEFKNNMFIKVVSRSKKIFEAN
jgi:acetolactate synthase I/II/III large subunit